MAVAERCVDILLFEFDQNPAMLAVRNGSQCEEHIFSNLAIEVWHVFGTVSFVFWTPEFPESKRICYEESRIEHPRCSESLWV